MKITIAKSSGFCFGVRRAIKTSAELAKKEKNVFVLGDIVHNSFVVRDLEKQGIKQIRRIYPIKNSRILIIRAHGAPKKTFEKAKNCGYKIMDATCPKVKDIYKISKKLEKDNVIIIVGDSKHDEVKGIIGQLKKKPLIINSVSKILKKKLSKIQKAAVITQSTQTLENISKIMTGLRKIIPNIKLHNTTCQTTIIKQQEIRSLPKKNDLMLILGSKTSANTKHLYQLSKRINRKTYWIESAKDINPSWIKNIKKIGIMAGASTPDYITREVVGCLTSNEKLSA
ncbi:MAG: 4-hydroxy-3-methylbut-2-enyl diphosphate reductase [Candidatus Omnitrophota bacterium]